MSNKPSIYYSNLPSRCIAVYLYLEKHGAKKKQCFHSMRTIASNLKLSRQTVNLAIQELKRKGYISIEHQYRKCGAKSSNLYHIRNEHLHS